MLNAVLPNLLSDATLTCATQRLREYLIEKAVETFFENIQQKAECQSTAESDARLSDLTPSLGRLLSGYLPSEDELRAEPWCRFLEEMEVERLAILEAVENFKDF